MAEGRILIVDDNKSALSALKILLQGHFNTITTLSNPNGIHAEFTKNEFDLVLLDMNFSAGVNTGNEGIFWLNEIKKIAPFTEVVLITAYGDVELAVKALKNGAADFVLKPWENEKLLATLNSVYKLAVSKREVLELRSNAKNLKKAMNHEKVLIIGSSSCIKDMLATIQKVASTNANVLITGENGTGKELVAREIHNHSNRSEELMVSVDMGAIPETLFESELFGHKKGAFTDAKEDMEGKFSLAHKGTLFLDEIGNLPIAMQNKLLGALQARKIFPVGSNTPVNIDIRLISATNMNLETACEEGRFREDLLYRLNTIVIEVPPLRNRENDIVELAEYYLNLYANKYNKGKLMLSQRAVKKLLQYNWPGNVRELQHMIERVVILSESGQIAAEDFVFRQDKKNANQLQQVTLEELERNAIEQSIEQNNGNMSLVASKLGITRQTLYNKLKKYDL